MSFIKHVGRHGDRQVAIMYRTVPGEEHMALVIYPDTLSTMFHDSVMKIIEGDIGQTAPQLAEAMHRSLLPDGRPMLQTLHQEGKIKKVPANQIVVTPNATSHVRLDELNGIFDGMAAGDEAAKSMADLDSNAGLVDRNEQRRNAEAAQTVGDVLSDEALGSQMFDQSTKMAAEGAALVAESKRLAKDAYKLNPSLKPKRTVRKALAE